MYTTPVFDKRSRLSDLETLFKVTLQLQLVMITLQQWRAVIGCFCPNRRSKTTIHGITIKRHAVSLVLRIAIVMSLCLLLSGDIESNPGPAGPAGTTRSHSSSRTRQQTLDPTGNIVADEPSLRDIMTGINNLNTTVTNMSQELKHLTSTVNTLQQNYTSVHNEVKLLKDENNILHTKLKQLETNLDVLEGHSRRQNILFFGIQPAQPNETNTQCEQTLRDTLHNKINLTNIRFDRVHRISSKKGIQPIIARVTDYKDKIKILKERHRLKGTQIFLSEDYTSRIRNVRKNLAPFVKQIRQQNKDIQVMMKFDHLIIDGERYDYCEQKNEVKSTARDHVIKLLTPST